MASAPVPGRQRQTGSQWFRMTIRDRTLELPVDVTMQERFAVRAATGVAFENFVEGEAQIGEDSFAVMWWLARRYNGESNLPFKQALSEWVPLKDLDVKEFAFEQIEDDGEDETPGKSVPA